MSNKGFTLPAGLKAGPLTIDATTGAITTSGNIQVTGAGQFVGTNAPGGAPSPAPAPAPSTDVKLLLNMNGANGSTTFTDSSTFARSFVRFGSTQISTAQSKFGGASAYFDGSSDLQTGPDSALDCSTTSFTIEFWYYQTGTPSVLGVLFNTRALTGAGSGRGLYLGITPSNQIKIGDGNSAQNEFTSVATISNNQWYHIAAVRNATTGRTQVFLNGAEVINTTSYAPYNLDGAHQYVNIASWGPSHLYTARGYIDDVRFTIGQALYTANFTPPAAQLTTTI